MDELYLTYPLTLPRGGRGPTQVTRPSRFLTEVDAGLYEQAILETEIDLSWSGIEKSRGGSSGRNMTSSEDRMMDHPEEAAGPVERGIALGGLLLAGLASGQGPKPSRFPTIPAEHAHARALLDNAMRYAAPGEQDGRPGLRLPVRGVEPGPEAGLFLRSFTQLTAIGQWMELLANVAAGQADTPAPLARAGPGPARPPGQDPPRTTSADPTLAAKGLLGNFLDLATGKRLGPLASNVDKREVPRRLRPGQGRGALEGPAGGRLDRPRHDDREADITRGAKYGYEHFDGPLAPFKDEPTRQKVMAILDARVVMLIFGDNSNLSASAAKTIGALLAPGVKDRPEAVATPRASSKPFLDAQQPGYARLYDAKAGLFYFGWDATRDRLFGWDDLQGNRTIGHMDYLVNEFRGPATFVAARFGLPADAIKNLGFKMKPYRTRGRPRALHARPLGRLGVPGARASGLSLGELDRPELAGDPARTWSTSRSISPTRKGLPGFLSESYTGDGTQYTGSVGIPEITVSPRPRITDAASLYTLGVAYSIAPDEVERFLAAELADRSRRCSPTTAPGRATTSPRSEPIPFQTTAHTLALILGLIGQGSENMGRYLESKGLGGRSSTRSSRPAPGPTSSPTRPAFAWTAKGATLDSGKEGGGLPVKGDAAHASSGSPSSPTARTGSTSRAACSRSATGRPRRSTRSRSS